MSRTRRVATTLGIAVAALAGCGSDTAEPAEPEAPVIDPGDGGKYAVTIDPANFSAVVDNPFLPLVPGSVREYIETSTDGGFERIRTEVLPERHTVMGVEAIVVHDVAFDAAGDVLEETYDWYAQDNDGNVWYFGEDTTSYEDGEASTEGSWEAGVGGALPGIVMPGSPSVEAGGYRQEFLAGEAEDMGQVIALDGTFEAPTGTYTDIVRTRDWTPLEPDVIEEKAYARGVGFVHESKTNGDGVTSIAVLISVERG